MRLVSAKQPALLRGGFTSEEFAAGFSRLPGEPPRAALGSRRRLRAGLRARLHSGLAAGGAGPHQEDALRHKDRRPGNRRGILEWCWLWTCGFTCFSDRHTQICAPPHTHTPTLPRLLLSRNVHNKSQQPGTLPPCCMCQTASRGGTRSPQLGSQRQAAARLPDLHPGLSRAAGCLRPRRHRGNLASTLASAQPSRWRRTPPSPPPAPPERLSQLSPNWGSGKSSQERSPQPRLERRSERARGGG